MKQNPKLQNKNKNANDAKSSVKTQFIWKYNRINTLVDSSDLSIINLVEYVIEIIIKKKKNTKYQTTKTKEESLATKIYV